jgi:hypothetical protein
MNTRKEKTANAKREVKYFLPSLNSYCPVSQFQRESSGLHDKPGHQEK